MILNVDRSTPEHAVHSTGSVGGGGQRGTGHGGPKGTFVPDASQILILSEFREDQGGKRVKNEKSLQLAG